MRIAFLGNAHVHARDYVAACSDHPGAALVGAACTETTPFAFPAHVPLFDRAADLPEHDLCVIVSDIAAHPAHVAEVRAPHVFVEKPLGTDEGAARRVARTLAASGAAFRTGLFLRHGAPVRRLREALRGGLIGAVSGADLTYVHSGLADGWLRDWSAHLDTERMGYGVFGDLAAHLVDLAHWCLGPLEVEGCRLTVVDGVEAAGTARLRTSEGVPVRVTAGALAGGRDLALRFEGETGTLAIAADALVLERPGVADPQVLAGPADLTPRAGFAAELNAAAADRPSAGASLEDAVRVNAVLDALHDGPASTRTRCRR